MDCQVLVPINFVKKFPVLVLQLQALNMNQVEVDVVLFRHQQNINQIH